MIIPIFDILYFSVIGLIISLYLLTQYQWHKYMKKHNVKTITEAVDKIRHEEAIKQKEMFR